MVYCTFREGLLTIIKVLPLTTWGVRLLAGVEGDGSPVSTSSGTPPFAFSCELSGPGASLLGAGVMLFETVFLKAGFLGGRVGFGIELAVSLAFNTPAEVLVDFDVPFEGALVKKL